MDTPDTTALCSAALLLQAGSVYAGLPHSLVQLTQPSWEATLPRLALACTRAAELVAARGPAPQRDLVEAVLWAAGSLTNAVQIGEVCTESLQFLHLP